MDRIRKTAGVCGGEACIANTRIPVWLLVGLRQLGGTDSQLLEAYPHLSADDLAAAWLYYSEHSSEIEAAIMRQELA
jgi:uncharacterized protein (DUF433 family)